MVRLTGIVEDLALDVRYSGPRPVGRRCRTPTAAHPLSKSTSTRPARRIERSPAAPDADGLPRLRPRLGSRKTEVFAAFQGTADRRCHLGPGAVGGRQATGPTRRDGARVPAPAATRCSTATFDDERLKTGLGLAGRAERTADARAATAPMVGFWPAAPPLPRPSRRRQRRAVRVVGPQAGRARRHDPARRRGRPRSSARGPRLRRTRRLRGRIPTRAVLSGRTPW